MLMKLQPLKNINFLSLYLNQICSILGDNIYRIVLIYLTYSIGGAKSLGIVFGAQAFTIFLTVLFAGSLTSFFRSKIILLISICLRGILSLLLIGVNIFKLNSVIIFLALGIIFGISESLDLRQVFGHKKIKFFCTTTIHGLFHVPSRLGLSNKSPKKERN
jgi:MFS family permease